MKKFLSIILTFVLCFGVLSVALASENDSVATVPDGYIGIYTAEDLDNVRNNLSGKYILMNNIDLSSYENWTPIGSSETPFTGDLDGNGYVIKNMKIYKECTDGDEPRFALFASTKNSDFNNLMLLDVDINVKFSGEDSESFRVASLSGYDQNSEFENCITSGNITVDGFDEGIAGGIIGNSSSFSLTNCVNYTNINLSTENVYDIYIGGISGNASTIIDQCCNFGNVTVSGTDSDEEFRKLKIGGLTADFGNYHSLIYDSYNKGNISIDFSLPAAYVGGISGYGFLIDSCYNTGSISVPENFSGFVGGISGLYYESWMAVMPTSYIENAYYNNDGLCSTYIEEGIAASDDYFTNVKYLTPEEMKKQESFIGFDFENVWAMEENGYPILRNTPVIPETEKPGVTKPTTTTEPTTDESTTTPATEESTTIPVATPTEPSTEESTTTPVATPIEPSTTEPTTKESTTVPVATPIEPSTTEPSTSEIITTETPTEPVTNPVTEPSTAEFTTQPATEPSTTQPVTETESTTEPVTESPATPIEPSTEPTSEPDDNRCWVLKWLIKIFKAIIDWFVKLFVMLGF